MGTARSSFSRRCVGRFQYRLFALVNIYANN